jgi:biotin carboxylase
MKNTDIILVVIGAGEFQLPVIERAIERGIKVIGFDGNENAVGLKFCSESYVIDITNAEQIISLLKALKYKIHGVLTLAAEVAVVTVSKIAEEFKLKGASIEASKICTNKYLMRKCFQENKIPSPAFNLLIDYKDYEKTISKFKYPFVIKPIDNAGSRGVVIVENQTELISAINHSISFSKSGNLIVEEFMHGVEISVEAFIQNDNIRILSLSDKIRTEYPYPLDTHVIFPSNKSEDIQNEAIEIAKNAIRAAGLNNSVVHMELMVTSFGVKVVEMAARGAGFHVFSKILKWVSGINTLDLLIDIALGNEIKQKSFINRGAILSFPRCSEGVIESISGLEEIQNLEHIAEAELYVKPGDRVSKLKSGSDRIGHIITLAATRDDALKINSFAENLLKIKIKDE